MVQSRHQISVWIKNKQKFLTDKKYTGAFFSGQVHSINISFHEFLWLTDTYKYVCQLLMLLHYNPLLNSSYKNDHLFI